MKDVFYGFVLLAVAAAIVWMNVYSLRRSGAEERVAYYEYLCAKHHSQPRVLAVEHCALGWYVDTK